MAIKHVITRGYGFADNTKFIPTRGYTPNTVVSTIVYTQGVIYAPETTSVARAVNAKGDIYAPEAGGELRDN